MSTPSKYTLQITPLWDAENHDLAFDTQGISAEIHREMVSFKDRVVREKLIQLGWTPPPQPEKSTSTYTTPNKEGWWWAKTGMGWTCVHVRQLEGVWVGLNPYDGRQYPLHFLDSTFWHGTTWHGEAIPPTENPSKA